MRLVDTVLLSIITALTLTSACIVAPADDGDDDSGDRDTDRDDDRDDDRDPVGPTDPTDPTDPEEEDPIEEEPSDDTGAFCDDNDDCATGCLFGSDDDGNQNDFGYCTNSCENFSECPDFWLCERVGNATGTFCVQRD